MTMLDVYCRGSSLAHLLDPRTKIVFVVLYFVSAFLAKGPVGLGLLALVTAGVFVASGEGLRFAVRVLVPFVWLMVLVGVFDSLFVHSGQVIFVAGPLCVSTGGIGLAVESVGRFVCVLLATSVLMRTTSPTALSDGVSLMLSPLAKFGVHTGGAALSVSMALRFVPVLVDEYSRVREAQEGRLARFSGSPVQQLRSLVPVSVPLFQSALRRAESLALAVENRGFDPNRSRSCLHSYRLRALDGAVLLFAIGFVVAVIVVH